MRVVSLGSGSSGNALLVEAGPQGRTKILIDAGLSTLLITDRLRSVGVHPSQLQAVLVTHEHSDHVIGLPTLMKRHAVPVVADPRTYQVLMESFASGMWRTDSGALIPSRTIVDGDPLVEPNNADCVDDILDHTNVPLERIQQNGHSKPTIALSVGSHCTIGDIEVISFPISHDAVAPCGYLLSAGGCRVCIVTDSGEVTTAMLEMMQQADLLILEANHDRERLLRGPYPERLKQRILSATGHLSNNQAAEAILRTWRTDSVRWLWLSHLSRTNNTPSLALKSVRAQLQTAGANLAQVHISVSPPGMGNVWDSTQLWHSPSLWAME
ncbi:MAG: MBL fold metallo-hydrolase [Chloroflexi bacterium]|nr:MBL fold metallo-hydrolase [Chloroflexota bacterium]